MHSSNSAHDSENSHTPEHCFTCFQQPIESYSLPERFTFPFYYEPHPLCEIASQQLQQHLETQTDWQHDFGLDSDEGRGKMFGVLIEKPWRWTWLLLCFLWENRRPKSTAPLLCHQYLTCQQRQFFPSRYSRHMKVECKIQSTAS